MSVREQLMLLVGSANFTDDPGVLEAYSADFSLAPRGAPNYVVKPEHTEEVQQVIQFANEHSLPVVPVSSAVHFYGATIPKQGGIVLDLTRMNRVLEIDELNRRVRVEAGVTWQQLTSELGKKGYRVMMPLLPHPLRSVVTDTLEREVPTNTVYDYGEPLQSMEVVWPTGEVFRTGSASVPGYPDSPSKGGNPSGPGLDFYRFLQGAQGTMGVVTWANLKIENLPGLDKILFAPVRDFNYAIDFLYRILRIRVGQECLLLNNVDLAAILADDWDRDFERLRATLPPWALILVISGFQRRPEEKIQYEERALGEILRNEFPDLHLAQNLAGVPNLGRKLLPMLRNPWPEGATYWKQRYKGGCQSLFFIAKPARASEFIDRVEETAARHDYPIRDIGIYLQPIEHNRACHLEFHFFYDPSSHTDIVRIERLYGEAAKVLLSEGALFTRPYGEELTRLVYERTADYTMTLRRLKKVFDPNHIMNPGNLCF
jgi:FAD/FMN-containing dehydrogenase